MPDSLSITYRINRVSKHMRETETTFAGETEPERVPRLCVEVEAYDEGEQHGTVTWRWYGADAKLALERFKPLEGSQYVLPVPVPALAEPEAA